MSMNEDALKRISELANLMVAQQAQVDEIEDLLKAAKADLLRITREDLPELMREYGLESIKLADSGITVSVKDNVSAKIPEDQFGNAVNWLVEHNYDGILKTEITVEFNRGEHDKAELAAEKLRDALGREICVDEFIHPATLKAFVKERMEAGDAIPFDVFGIQPYSEAKLKFPRG